MFISPTFRILLFRTLSVILQKKKSASNFPQITPWQLSAIRIQQYTPSLEGALQAVNSIYNKGLDLVYCTLLCWIFYYKQNVLNSLQCNSPRHLRHLYPDKYLQMNHYQFFESTDIFRLPETRILNY